MTPIPGNNATVHPFAGGESRNMTKAETLTLTFVIRPSYADAATVLQEIEDSLDWLSSDHHAVSLVTVNIGEGHWLEEDAE